MAKLVSQVNQKGDEERVFKVNKSPSTGPMVEISVKDLDN